MAITLLQITDTHIHDQQDASFKNTQPDISLNQIINHAKKNLTNIDYVMVTGDLTHDGTEPAYKRLAALLNQFDSPVYVTPGNHDSTELIQQYLLSAKIQMPEQVETAHWQLLFADSHIENQTAGWVSDNSIKSLSTQLQQCNKPAFLFTHHPPVKINSLWMDEIGMKNGEQLLQILSHHKNLHGLAFGHIHQDWHSHYQHIEVFGTPSTCVQFKANSDDFALDENFSGYRVIELHDNGELDSHIIRLKPESPTLQ